jgi:hypothetical protein
VKTVRQVIQSDALHIVRGEFAGMLRDKEQRSEESRPELWGLEEWREWAKASGIAELKAFALKLLQDTEAVVWPRWGSALQPGTDREGRINKLSSSSSVRCTGEEGSSC